MMKRSAVASLAVLTLAATSLACSAASEEDEIGASEQALVSRPGARLFLDATVLARLKARAAAGDQAWKDLRAECDALSTGTMNPPNGDEYPNFPNVGQGYQGEEYVSPMMSLGLCYRVSEGVDAAAATKYGAAGVRLLEAISTPGGQAPSTDSGYGIRNYGVSMAVGFDWLYPVLSSSTKSRVVGTLNQWIDWYDQNGFIKNDPIGNYFAGYFLAKTTAALATEGDNGNAATYLADVQNRMWGQLVKPEFTRSMAGGGWPEGWQYGPRAVRAVLEAMWAMKTAKGVDWNKEVPQVGDQARYLSYFAWPSLKHMDDQGTVRSGSNIQPSPTLSTSIAMIAEYMGDPVAGQARAFASDVLASAQDDRDAWVKFLYWDTSLAKNAYTSRPLSYVAKGPNHMAMRSSWNKDATWGAFTSGTYITASDSGEQMLNQGSFSVVRGDQPVIVNAAGWMPQVAGTPGENFVYEDAWGQKTRKLYNTFYVADSDNLYSPGQGGYGPDEAKTHVERAEDLGALTRVRGANIEDMYRPASGASKPVTQYTRDMVYFRPGTFVLFDRTGIKNAGSDQWMAFHTPSAPASVGTNDGSIRYDVKANGATIGSVRNLLPRGSSAKVESLLGGLARIETHAPSAAQHEWLSVVTATDATPEMTRLSTADGNVASGDVVGVHVKGARQSVALFPANQASTATTSGAKYTVQQTGDADHVLVDVAASASGYAVTATPASGGFTITVAAGGTFKPTANGSLAFTVSSTGAIAGIAAPATTPAPSPTTTPVIPMTPLPTPGTPTPSTPTPGTEPEAPKPVFGVFIRDFGWQRCTLCTRIFGN